MATIMALVGTGLSVANQAGAFSGGGGDAPQIETPKAAEYEPVDFTMEQLATIAGNQMALPQIGQLVKGADKIITNQALRRARALIPGYDNLMQLQSTNATNFMGGRLPYDDVLGIVDNRAGLNSTLNIGGVDTAPTLKDLGIGQLEAMKTGSSMLNQMVSMAQTISPIDRYMTPQMMMLNPLDRIRLAMEQNQLIQQSEQNKNNLEAMGSSNLTPGGGGGFNAGAIGSGISQLGSMMGGMGGGAGGGSSTWWGAGGPTSVPSPSASTYQSWRPGYQPGTYYAPNNYFGNSSLTI